MNSAVHEPRKVLKKSLIFETLIKRKNNTFKCDPFSRRFHNISIDKNTTLLSVEVSSLVSIVPPLPERM